MKKALLLFLCVGCITAQIRPIDKGKVVVVYDGDTVKVELDNGSEERVRLIGIDSPELAAVPEETQLEALLAKRFAFHHLFRRPVELGYDWELEDKYGRLLAYVWIEGRLFNEFILEQGFARVFLKFPFAMEDRFMRAQNEAREKGRGFWQEKPYSLVLYRNARKHTGKLMRVKFVCTRMKEAGSFLYIFPRTDEFVGLIPKEYWPLFGDIRDLEGKAVEVSGFLEEYRGQPQIMIFFPSQLKLAKEIEEKYHHPFF